MLKAFKNDLENLLCNPSQITTHAIKNLLCAIDLLEETTIDKKYVAWILADNHNHAAESIWQFMTGFKVKREFSQGFDVAPYNFESFNACFKLLELYPEWKPRMSEMGGIYEWSIVIKMWDHIEALYLSTIAGEKELWNGDYQIAFKPDFERRVNQFNSCIAEVLKR